MRPNRTTPKPIPTEPMNPFLLRLSTDIPMMLEDRLIALASMTADDVAKAANVQGAAHPAIAKYKAALAPQYSVASGGVAVLPVAGALMMNPDLWSMVLGQAEDLELLTEQVQKMGADPEVSAAVLKLDTPGGMMTGGIEFADAVAELNTRKPVIAWTGSLCASLGYLVASQASEIIATRSAQVGSIGTILSVMDWTEYLKGLGVKIHTFTNKEGTLKSILPMNEEREAYLQSRADTGFAMFRDMVKAKRPEVKDGAMKGQVITAQDAQGLGLVDRIGDFQFALSVARQAAKRRGA